MSQVLTAVIRNRLCNFVCSNKYIVFDIQKGFWKDVSECIEHTETLSYIIKLAILKQQSSFKALLNFKNAIGEMNQSLIRKVMKMHRVSDKFVKLIHSLCTGRKIFQLTDSSQTSSIYVLCGVFQTNSLTLLVFNLLINILINIIKKDKMQLFVLRVQRLFRK